MWLCGQTLRRGIALHDRIFCLPDMAAELGKTALVIPEMAIQNICHVHQSQHVNRFFKRYTLKGEISKYVPEPDKFVFIKKE
jgi:hypothetical protein